MSASMKSPQKGQASEEVILSVVCQVGQRLRKENFKNPPRPNRNHGGPANAAKPQPAARTARTENNNRSKSEANLMASSLPEINLPISIKCYLYE